MFTYKELLAELKCDEQDLKTILQHGLIKPISTDQGMPIYGSNTVDILKEEFDELLKKCNEMDLEDERLAVHESRKIYRNINDKNAEERGIGEEHEERSEDTEEENTNIEDENEAEKIKDNIQENNEADTFLSPIFKEDNTKKKKKERKKTIQKKVPDTPLYKTSYEEKLTAGMPVIIDISQNPDTSVSPDAKSYEYNRFLAEQKRQGEEYNRALAEQKRQEEECNRTLAEQKRQGDEYNRFLAEQKRQEEEYNRTLAEQKRQGDEYNRTLTEQKRQGDEYNRFLAEQKRQGEEYNRTLAEQKRQKEEYITQQYIEKEENKKKYEEMYSNYSKTGESIYIKPVSSDNGEYIAPHEQYKKETIRHGHDTHVLLDSSDAFFSETHSQDTYDSYYKNTQSWDKEFYPKVTENLYKPNVFSVGPSYGMQKTVQINVINSINGTGTTKIGNGQSFMQDTYENIPSSNAINKLYHDGNYYDGMVKVTNEAAPTAEQEYEYRQKQAEKQLIVTAIVSKRVSDNNNMKPEEPQYHKVLVRSTKAAHCRNIIYSDRKIDFQANCRYRIITDKKLVSPKSHIYVTNNINTFKTLQKAKRQYRQQNTRKVNYQVHYEDVKLKQKNKTTQPFTQTTGRFFVENTEINRTDAAQAIHLVKKYTSPFGSVLAGSISGAAMSVLLKDMNRDFDFNAFSKLFTDNHLKTKNVFIEGHGFIRENIDGFFDMGCKYFSKKYSVDFKKLSDKSIRDFTKKLSGKDAELWKALIQSKQFKQANITRIQYMQGLRNMLFHAALKTIDGTDAYKGGMILYRTTMTVRMAVKTTREIGKLIATPVAKKVLASSRDGFIKATNNNKDVVKFFDDVSKKKASHIQNKEKKQIEKVHKKNDAIKKRLDRKKRRKENVKKYFSNTKAGKTFKKVMNTSGGKKVGKAMNKFTKIAGTTMKGVEKILGFLSRFNMYVYLIIGAVFLIWILWTFISAALSQAIAGFYNTLPSLGKDIFDKVAQISVGDDNEGLTDREKEAKDTIDLIKHVYDKNSEWYDSLSENEKKTPEEVNGGKVYGGTNPRTNRSTVINTWGCPGKEGIFYESYNGNAISVDSTDINAEPSFVEGNLQSLYDKSANTKAIFCMTYIHYNGILTDNQKKMKEFEDMLFKRSHVVSNKVSELYQCDSGCQTLKNYKCNNASLNNTNCKGPVIEGSVVNYNFLKSDNNGKINNHSGKGCTSYYCTDSKSGNNSWKTDAGKKYGCKQKTNGIKETSEYECEQLKTLDSAYFEAQQGKTYLTFDEIAQITEKINADNKAKADETNENRAEDEEEIEAEKVDDPTSYIPRANLSPKPNGSVVTKNNKKYTLKDGTVLGVRFNKNGTCKIYFHYAAYYCNGKHYGCQGKHIKTYCPGHVDLTIRFASAGIGEDEYDDCKLTALDPYKEAGSYEKIKHVDDNSPKPMWEGWKSDTNTNWLYELYNQDWDELGDWSLVGMGDMNGSVEAGANDFEIGDYDFGFDESLYNINGGDGPAAAAFANSKLGIPYSQALRNDGKHFDCSSLVYYAYKSTGLSIMYKGANTAAAQAEWAVRGKRALYVRGSSDNSLNNLSKWSRNNWANLKPGDCIYYNYGNGTNGRFMNINHAAIYYGNGLLIDASSSKGKVVKRPIYSSHYIQVISRPTSSTSASNVKRDGIEMRHANYTTITNMSYTAVTSRSSAQYKILNHRTRAKTNSTNGIRMYKCTDGSDGKTGNGYVWRYCVAMGTYYGKAGSKFDIWFKGNKTPIRVIMGDVKSDAHTDPNHMYQKWDKSTVECITGNITKYNAARTAGKNAKPIAFPANNSIETIIYRGVETSWSR